MTLCAGPGITTPRLLSLSDIHEFLLQCIIFKKYEQPILIEMVNIKYSTQSPHKISFVKLQVLSLGLGVDFTFAGDNHKNENDNDNPDLNFVKGTVLGIRNKG